MMGFEGGEDIEVKYGMFKDGMEEEVLELHCVVKRRERIGNGFIGWIEGG